MKRKDMIDILLAARPYIQFDASKLLDLAADETRMAQAKTLVASEGLTLAEALFVAALEGAQSGLIIHPSWLPRTVSSVKYYKSGSGNPTWRCALDGGGELFIRQSNKAAWTAAGYTALEQMRLGDEWDAAIAVYLTPGEKGFWDCQRVVPGGFLEAPAIDEAVERRAEVKKTAAHWLHGVQDFYFLDTETTGKNDHDEVIEIAIVDYTGETVLNTRVNCTEAIHPDAQKIHGISLHDLVGAPLITEIMVQGEPLGEWLKSHMVVTYGAEFDEARIRRSFENQGQTLPPLGFQCAMRLYAKFNGTIHPRTGEYQYVKLIDACKDLDIETRPDHSALGDAGAAYDLIQALANSSDKTPF